MTGKGHTQCGIAFSILPASIAYANMGLVPSILAAITCIVGSTAPDWMEIRVSVKGGGSKTLIPHRTITHIVGAWVLLAVYSYCSVKSIETPFYDLPLMENDSLSASLFGFACGGLVHLFGDLPNKQKIPILTLWDGIALNLWKSGKNEGLMVFLTFAIASGLLLKELTIV